jgi:hypothetical protein
LSPAPTLASEVETWLTGLSTLAPGDLDEAAALEAITAMERLKRGAAAMQARLSVRVDELARQRQSAAGVRAETLGQGVGAQIALARMESPHRGGRHLGLAKTLVAELPQTLAGMARGEVGEWQATLVARETACVGVETRRAVDASIADRLPTWGDAQAVREVRRLTYAAEPASVVKRHAQAQADRTVTLRPAPDTMCYLTALLPAVQGVAAYASLVTHADRARASGDSRRKGQSMADALVERVTGQGAASDVPVEVELVVPVETLLSDGSAPAHLAGYGPMPAPRARDLIRDTSAQVWLRRLFSEPASGRLVAMDSRRELFTGQLRHFVILRDQFCRTPWCDAQIRHTDHPTPRRDEGVTDAENAQGLCEACNYAKEAPGWRAEADSEGTEHLVRITTPTGRRYTSRAPDPPGAGPPSGRRVRIRP